MFSSIDSTEHNDRNLNNQQKAKLKCLFCDFLKDCLEMPISEVDQKYGRPVDYGDVAIENDESFQPVHYGLHERLAKNVKKPYGYFARLHGYYNKDGYFVITRFDWCHKYHEYCK